MQLRPSVCLTLCILSIVSSSSLAHAESAVTGVTVYAEDVLLDGEQSFSEPTDQASTTQIYGEIDTSSPEEAGTDTPLPWEYINVRPFPPNPIQLVTCRGCDLDEETLYYREPIYICAFDLSKLPGLDPELAKKKDIRKKVTFKNAIDAGPTLSTCGPVFIGTVLTPCESGESKTFSKTLVPACDYSEPVREADGSLSYTCDQKPSSWLGIKIDGAPPVLQTCQRPTVTSRCPTLLADGNADRHAVCESATCEVTLPGTSSKFALPCSGGLTAARMY